MTQVWDMGRVIHRTFLKKMNADTYRKKTSIITHFDAYRNDEAKNKKKRLESALSELANLLNVHNEFLLLFSFNCVLVIM